MTAFRNALAVTIGFTWLLYCGLVLKYTCDHLPVKAVAKHKTNEQQNESSANAMQRIDVAKDQPATNENAQARKDQPSNVEPECDWCSVNWAGWVQDAAILVAAFVAWKTLKAIEHQAIAARQSADAFQITQRAQIGVPHTEWKAFYDARGTDLRYQLEINYSFKNTGPTLGFFSHVVFFSRMPIGHDSPPIEFSEDDGDWDNPAMLLPGQSLPQIHHPFFSSVGVAPSEIDDLRNGKTAYWIQGRISYRDIFGVAHYTNFTTRYYLPAHTFSFPLGKGYADGN